jgi:hypothetical protein
MSMTHLKAKIGKVIHKKPIEQVREVLGDCLLSATMQVFGMDEKAAAHELSEMFKSFVEGRCRCCGEKLENLPTSTH